jgi:hypothetical protein
MNAIAKALIRITSYASLLPVRHKASRRLKPVLCKVIGSSTFFPSVADLGIQDNTAEVINCLINEIKWCRITKIYPQGPVGWCDKFNLDLQFDFFGLRIDAARRRSESYGAYAARHELEHEIQFLLFGNKIDKNDWKQVCRFEWLANKAAIHYVRSRHRRPIDWIVYNELWLKMLSLFTAFNALTRFVILLGLFVLIFFSLDMWQPSVFELALFVVFWIILVIVKLAT